jgi:hypothetical protein
MALDVSLKLIYVKLRTLHSLLPTRASKLTFQSLVSSVTLKTLMMIDLEDPSPPQLAASLHKQG